MPVRFVAVTHCHAEHIYGLQVMRDAGARIVGEASRNLAPFDEAYARTDGSRLAQLPLFAAANRMNVHNTYLLMEHEAP